MKRNLPFLLITLVGALLRLYRLDYQSVWLDEGYQYYFASAPTFAGVLDRVLDPNVSTHPPLSHLIHHAFLTLGKTDFDLRLPSALFGIAALPLCYVLATYLFSPGVALLSMLLMAVSPFHVWFSQEARMYAQLIFFVLLASCFLLGAVRRKRFGWWVFYAAAATGGMYTHIYMAFTLAAHGIWLLAFERRHVVSYTAAGAVVTAAFSPMVPFFLAARTVASNEVPPGSVGFSWAALPYTLYAYAAGFSLGPSVRELKMESAITLVFAYLPTILTVALVFGSSLAWALTWTPRDRHKELWFCLLGMAVPIVASVGMSMLPWLPFNVRYTAGGLPFFCILAAWGLSNLHARHVGAAVALASFVLLTSWLSLRNLYTNSRYAKEDIRDAVAEWRGDSNRAYLATALLPPVERYLQDSELARYLAIRDSTQIAAALRTFISSQSPDIPTVWVLIARDFDGAQERSVRRAFGVTEELTLPGVKLLKLSPSQGGWRGSSRR